MIAKALIRHFHGDLYAPWPALGHDEVPAGCNACWIAAELAVRAVAQANSREVQHG